MISGCISINPGDLTSVEHMEVKTVHNASEAVDLDASTINGNIEIQVTDDDTVQVIYDVFAPKDHLYDIQTGTNGSRDGNVTKIIAEAKLQNNADNAVVNRGANIVVKVPKNATINLSLQTLNGNVIVPALNGNGLVAHSNNGNIDLTIMNNSKINADTLNGNINVKLLNDTLFSVEASTMSGNVGHGQIRMTPDKETSTQLIGHTEAGSGSLNMYLRTMNGNIEISY
jgi:DUF4097 and DUF4098 domain-containing protein YvlB